MKHTDFGRMPCPIARSLGKVGEWWSILILRDAFYGLTRFDEFEKSLKIAPNMLTRRLAGLVEGGLRGRGRPEGGGAVQRPPPALRVCADQVGPRLQAGAAGLYRLGQRPPGAGGR